MSSVAQFAEQMSQNQENAYETIGNNYYSWFEDSMNTSLGYITNSLYTTYTGLNGKLLKDGLTDKFYRVKIVVDHDSEARTYYKQKVALTPAAESKLSSLLTDLGMSYRNVLQGDYTTISPAFIYEGEPYTVTVSLEEVSQGGLTLTTTATNVPKNTPYKIIQIPYCDENGKRASYKINGVARYNDPEVCYGIAQKLIEKLSSTGALYDAQLLPYCLQQTNIVGNILSFNTDQTGTAQVAFINDSDNHHKGIAIYCDTASTEFTINYPWTIENYKIESQTDMLRFCSPTYANCYEINPAKNGGISTVSVSMTAKPHVPYIRVAPNFGRLYGSQFSKDSRGLICAGDFSLPQTTDAWMQFQAQNATFQQSFDRRIENMEVNNSIARKQQK